MKKETGTFDKIFASKGRKDKIASDKAKPKIDKINNSKKFFTFDISKIYKIIEKGFKIKLSDKSKTIISDAISSFVSHHINNNNSHGLGKIYKNKIIDKINLYLTEQAGRLIKLDSHTSEIIIKQVENELIHELIYENIL